MLKSLKLGSAALSADMPRWQLPDLRVMSAPMKRILALGLILSTPSLAAPGGEIATMTVGYFACELPGDATGPVGRRVEAEDFSIINASSYQASGTSGTYLLTGDTLVMTSGPRQGKRYHRQSSGFLRLSGPDGELRCVRQHRNNG